MFRAILPVAAPGWPGERHRDPAAGEAIGRAIGAAVLAQAATDNYLVVPTGSPPVGPGKWVSSGAAIVRSLHGVRPFFLSSPSQLRSPPPPAFGSPEFLAALAVRFGDSLVQYGSGLLGLRDGLGIDRHVAKEQIR